MSKGLVLGLIIGVAAYPVAANSVARVPVPGYRRSPRPAEPAVCRVSRERTDSVSRQRETTTLWRPTGPVELELVRESGWRAWPPRLPEQPIFYPVLNESYAVKIARDWNVKHVRHEALHNRVGV